MATKNNKVKCGNCGTEVELKGHINWCKGCGGCIKVVLRR